MFYSVDHPTLVMRRKWIPHISGPGEDGRGRETSSGTSRYRNKDDSLTSIGRLAIQLYILVPGHGTILGCGLRRDQVEDISVQRVVGPI